MKKVQRKLRDSGGVTLIETLCAVVILTLLGLLLNTGLQMAVKSYHDMTAESETQLLLNTLTNALSDKLRYSTVTRRSDGTFASSIGEITLDGGTEGQVLVNGKSLLPDGAYGNGRYIVKGVATGGVAFYLGPDRNCYQLTLTVKEASGNISAGAELTVRCLNPLKKEGTTP